MTIMSHFSGPYLAACNSLTEVCIRTSVRARLMGGESASKTEAVRGTEACVKEYCHLCKPYATEAVYNNCSQVTHQ